LAEGPASQTLGGLDESGEQVLFISWVDSGEKLTK